MNECFEIVRMFARKNFIRNVIFRLLINNQKIFRAFALSVQNRCRVPRPIQILFANSRDEHYGYNPSAGIKIDSKLHATVQPPAFHAALAFSVNRDSRRAGSCTKVCSAVCIYIFLRYSSSFSHKFCDFHTRTIPQLIYSPFELR